MLLLRAIRLPALLASLCALLAACTAAQPPATPAEPSTSTASPAENKIPQEPPYQPKPTFLVEKMETDSGPSARMIPPGSPVHFTVTIKNTGQDIATVKVRFLIDSVCVAEKFSEEIPPGDTADVSFQKTFTADMKGNHRIIMLTDEPNGATSAAQMDCTVRNPLKVLIIDGDMAGGFDNVRNETWILRYMLYPFNSDEDAQNAEFRPYIGPPTVIDHLFKPSDAHRGYADFDLVIIANLKLTPVSPTDDELNALEAYVKDGGKVIFWLGDNVNAADYNDRLYKNGDGILPAQLGELVGQRYDDTKEMKDKTSLSTEALDHPLMSRFKESKILERADENPTFSRYFMLKLPPKNTTVIARFDAVNTFSDTPGEKLPAVVERQVGDKGGRVILVNTTADGEWNNMIVSPRDAIYLVLLHEMVLHLTGFDSKFDLLPSYKE
jgi:hypothetical protein